MSTEHLSGWFRIDRRLLSSDLWLNEPFTRGQAWIDLVGLARFEPGCVRIKGRRIDLERGQLAWSEEGLASRWNRSRGWVRRFKEELESDHRIVQHKSNVTTVLTILNYHRYQAGGTADKTEDKTEGGTRNKNGKKEKNGKKGVELPSILDNPKFIEALSDWKAYRGRAMTPRVLKSLISQAAKRAETHGVQSVIDAFTKAQANAWKGWDFDSSFSSSNRASNGTHVGNGQIYEPGKGICNEL